jgi:hypothetical protein
MTRKPELGGRLILRAYPVPLMELLALVVLATVGGGFVVFGAGGELETTRIFILPGVVVLGVVVVWIFAIVDRTEFD